MNLLVIAQVIALVGIAIGLVGIILRMREILNRPFRQDLSRPQGSAWRGVLYAFTLGMAPWEKESTRKHWVAYIRGILFHLGTFTALAVLLASPWLGVLPAPLIWFALLMTGAGALFGFAGIFMRLAGANERVLSLPDDYFAVFLTSLFITLAFIVLLFPAWLPAFYIVAGITCAYIPFGKIRHCAYFFYSKFFFGRNFGHRGVIGQPKSKYVD